MSLQPPRELIGGGEGYLRRGPKPSDGIVRPRGLLSQGQDELNQTKPVEGRPVGTVERPAFGFGGVNQAHRSVRDAAVDQEGRRLAADHVHDGIADGQNVETAGGIGHAMLRIRVFASHSRLPLPCTVPSVRADARRPLCLPGE